MPTKARSTSPAAWERGAPVLVLALVVWLGGCGSNGVAPVAGPSGSAPVIVSQPQSATVPLNSAASFSVGATGSGTLSYQWSENGNPVSGGTAAALTTGALQLADSGDRFTVTVSNAFGSVTSDAAVITIGPRSPNARDLRFKHVQLASKLSAESCPVGQICVHSLLGTFPGSSTSLQYGNAIAFPLQTGNSVCVPLQGAAECEWSFQVDAPPSGVTGFNVLYNATSLADIDATLGSIVSNGVVTSLDVQPAAAAFSYTEEVDPSATGGFTVQSAHVADSSVAATLQQWAAQGIVATAVSNDAQTGVDLLGYRWSGAASTVYDAQAVFTSYSNVMVQAQSLSQQGYILTAVGTADANQVLLVGTKVHGDTLPRPFYGYSPQAGTLGTQFDGMVMVGWLDGTDGGFNPGVAATIVNLWQ